MEVLDADDAPLSTPDGQTQERDNVQFVPFADFGKSATRLQREVLYELPSQVLEYFERRMIKPNPPRERVDPGGNASPMSQCDVGIDPAKLNYHHF